MPKYSEFKIKGYYLYFTSKCIIEAIHAHASEKGLKERGSAKLWVLKNGDSIVERQGSLSNTEIKAVQEFIKNNLSIIVTKWAEFKGLKSIEEIEFINKK